MCYSFESPRLSGPKVVYHGRMFRQAAARNEATCSMRVAKISLSLVSQPHTTPVSRATLGVHSSLRSVNST